MRNKLTKFLGTLAVAALVAMPLSALAVAPADYGLLEGDTIRASGDADIFIVNEHGYKRLFVNPAIFNVYGHLGWSKVKTVSPAARDAFGTSGFFRNAEVNDGKVYALEVVSDDVAVLHWLNMTGAEAAAQDPNFFKKVFNINSAEQALYGVGAPWTSLSGSVAGNSGGLQGGAGELEGADFVSSLNNEEVGEGASNVKVLGLDLEADNGSDLRFMSAKLVLENLGGGSQDLDDYAESVSVWLGSKKLAEVDVDDFNEDGDVWSKNVSLGSDAVVRMDESGKLYVAVSAQENIDSSDLAANGWVVKVDSLRYVDAEGAITTDDSTGDLGTNRPFTFESFATAADLELSVDESNENPVATMHEVDAESGKDGVVLLAGTLKAEGGDIEVKEVSVDVVASGDTLGNIAKQFILEIDGVEVQTVDAGDCTGGTCEFDDVDTVLAEDEEVDVRVLVDVNGTDEFANGSSLTASLNSNDIVAEDQNGDDMNTLSGAIAGEAQAFNSEGISVALVGSPTITYNGEDNDEATAVIKFKVTAFGDDAFVDLDDYSVGTTATVSAKVLTSDADAGAFGFEVAEGTTEEFTLAVVITAPVAGFYDVSLDNIKYAHSDVNGTLNYNFNLDDFETDPLFLNI